MKGESCLNVKKLAFIRDAIYSYVLSPDYDLELMQLVIELLTPPSLLIGVLLITYLPPAQKHYGILFSLVFWVAYYTWIAIEEKKKKDTDK